MPLPPQVFQAFIGDESQDGFLPLRERLQKISRGKNPFCTTTLPENSPVFFGREMVIDSIVSNFIPTNPRGNISLLGEHSMGKSSLVNQVVQELRSKPGVITLRTSVHGWGDMNPSALFADMARAIVSVWPLGGRQSADEVNDFARFQDFVSKLSKDYRVVVVIDEFEDMTKNTNFNSAFFSNLRHLGESASSHLSFFVVSRQSLEQLCHQKKIESSRFWNIFKEKVLGTLSSEEAEQLIHEGMTRSLKTQWQRLPLENHLSLASAHPALLQIVLDDIWLAKTKGVPPNLGEIRHAILPHLKSIWAHRSKREQEILAFLAHGKTQEDGSTLREMKILGIINDENFPFSQYFAEIIRELLPLNQIRIREIEVINEKGGNILNKVEKIAGQLGNVARAFRNGTQDNQNNGDDDPQ